MAPKGLLSGTQYVLSAFLCVLALSGCAGSSPDKVSDQATAAAKSQSNEVTPVMLALPEAAYEAGHYDDALRLYRELLVRDPNNNRVKLGIADCELASKDPSGANQLYQELGNDPSIHARVLQGQGIALLRLGQNGPAEKALKEAVAADATLWRAWNALGALDDANQKWDDANQAYAKALALAPRSAAINNNLGFSLLSQEKLEQAIKSFQAALEIDPSLQPAQMNLRIALALEGRYDEAAAGIQGPSLPATLNNIGFAAMARGDYAKAEAYFTQAVNASSSYEEMASKNLLELKVITGKGASPSGT
jgi:Flp pilus assembly protein TadD